MNVFWVLIQLFIMTVVGVIFGLAAHDLWPIWSKYGLTTGWHLAVMVAISLLYVAVWVGFLWLAFQTVAEAVRNSTRSHGRGDDSAR